MCLVILCWNKMLFNTWMHMWIMMRRNLIWKHSRFGNSVKNIYFYILTFLLKIKFMGIQIYSKKKKVQIKKKRNFFYFRIAIRNSQFSIEESIKTYVFKDKIYDSTLTSLIEGVKLKLQPSLYRILKW